MAVRISTFDDSATSVLKNWSQAIEDRLKQLEKSGTISKQGNFVLNRLLNPTDVNTGNGYWWLSPTHMSYRPLTNPLHGIIVGGQPAIDVTSFLMRVGHQDILNNGGQIATGLSWDTLYFVYYDDIDLSGGVQTYYCDRFKEVALVGDGRLFVGSVRTPLSASSIETLGNNDGGVGAQMGGHVSRYSTVQENFAEAEDSITRTGTITFPFNATDKNWLTATTASITADAGGVFHFPNTATAYVLLKGFGSLDDSDRWFTHLRLRVKASGTSSGQGYTGAPATSGGYVRIQYSINGGVSWINIRESMSAQPGWNASLALQTDTITLPDGTNPNNVSVRVFSFGNVDNRPNLSVNAAASAVMYEAILEGDY